MSARISPYRPPRLDSVAIARSARSNSRNSNNIGTIHTSRSSSGSYVSNSTNKSNQQYPQRLLHTSQSERRTTSLTREPFTPPEVILQRHYSDPCPSPLPLRYSHHNQYGRGYASATSMRDSASRSGSEDGSGGGGAGGGGGKPFMQLFSSRMLRLKLMQNQRRQTMPLMAALGFLRVRKEALRLNSNSTPTAALSNAELLYGPEGSRSSHANGDDLVGSSDFQGGYERERQRLRDLDVASSSINSGGSNHNINGSNKRPSSRNRQQRAACSVVEKVSFDRERDEARALTNSLPVKAPSFRTNGLRSTLVRGEQLLAQRGGNGPTSGREPEDLIAMGTLWNPSINNNANNNNTGGSNTRSSSNTTSSNKSANNILSNGTNTGNGASQRKPVSVAMNTSMRLHHSSSTGNLPYNGNGNVTGRHINNNNSNNNSKEVEPKYPDPIHGATTSFQQRLMELAALEAETIRWERTKKVKKKPKTDRDS